MIYDKLVILTKLVLEKYPQIKPFVKFVLNESPTYESYFIERFEADWNEIYKALSTQIDRNKLSKSDLSLDERIKLFIEMEYEELIELDKYYQNFISHNMIENDLHDMNKIYKKLKIKNSNGIFKKNRHSS